MKSLLNQGEETSSATGPGDSAASLRESVRRIAHDFNNTLGIIIGNLELVRMDLEPNHPATESVTEIRKAAEQAKNLAAQLLTLTDSQLSSETTLPSERLTGHSSSSLDTGSPPPSPARGNGQHILFLDDEEPLVFLATNLFTRLGYRVTGFTRFDDALSAFQTHPEQYDLVVTDFNLPNASGLEFASAILAIRPEMPVILSSGEISVQLTERARLAGIRHVVYKPNTVDDLCHAIHRVATAL